MPEIPTHVLSAYDVMPSEPLVNLRIGVEQHRNSPRITFTFFDPVVGGVARWVADPYSFRAIMKESADVLDWLDGRIASPDFSNAVESDPELLERLGKLSHSLNSMRFRTAESMDCVGELIEHVIATSVGRPTMAVDADMGLIPWELISPDGKGKFADMLGTRAHIVGELTGDDWDPPAAYNAPRTRFGRRAYQTFDGELRIRAAGNHRLAGADEEYQLLTNSTSFVNGSVADPIRRSGDEAGFFSHFRGEDYQIAHFYCHCRYDAGGFVLKVSAEYDLFPHNFNRHRATFKTNAFHFLNVCSAAPTPRTRDRSFLEYVSRQHRAGGMVASLTSVRSLSAVEMARAFYREYLPKAASVPGRCAAEALWEARRELLLAGSPAGYLYRVYGHPKAYLTPLEQHMEAIAEGPGVMVNDSLADS